MPRLSIELRAAIACDDPHMLHLRALINMWRRHRLKKLRSRRKRLKALAISCECRSFFVSLELVHANTVTLRRSAVRGRRVASVTVLILQYRDISSVGFNSYMRRNCRSGDASPELHHDCREGSLHATLYSPLFIPFTLVAPISISLVRNTIKQRRCRGKGPLNALVV